MSPRWIGLIAVVAMNSGIAWSAMLGQLGLPTSQLTASAH